MKFTLKPYQRAALEDMLSALERAQGVYERESVPSSVSLSATTGAGKTVIASAVIESLFYGNDDFDYEPDDGALVIWFSDDPNLNDQTRARIMQASDEIVSTDLVTIEAPFSKPKLEAGKVYFLNTQKLSKTSLLTRGHRIYEEGEVLPGMESAAQPDMQGWTIWETIANTIADPELTLYLIVDEAHRGFGTKATRDKSTIVQRLVNGHAGYPPVPIVWGISATIGDFKSAMEDANVSGDRVALRPVQVDGFQVQESGLVKDVVKVDIPAEAQAIDMMLVKRAAKKLVHSSERWQSYCTSQGLSVVKPLLVLQSPNTPDHDKLGEALDVIFEAMPELSADSVRHVFGDHTVQTFGAYRVDWIEPQVVQDRTNVRVLVAKDAVSTGWDCPRAEVLVSFRPAKDHDHIQQLLGRMVRTPLARRIPGDEELNSVDCLLPFFDTKAAGHVVKLLTAQIDGVPDSSTRKVILDECVMTPNGALPTSVWRVWDQLPTMTIPQRGTSPVKRLASLGLALSADGLHQNALADITHAIHGVLDDATNRYRAQVKRAAAEVLAVRLQEISARFGAKGVEYNDIVEEADDRAIRVAFEGARRAFGADIANGYVDRLTGDDPSDESLRDAFVTTTALSCVPDIREAVDRAADRIAEEWFAQYTDAIQSLPDDRQQEYRDINALAASPQVGRLGRPRTRIEDYTETDEEGQISKAELVKLHLMSDENGDAPIAKLNDWEGEVVKHELSRDGALAWYRNPPRQTADSLGVAYRDEQSGNWRSMHPDFIFFHEINGVVRASIVDPHGHHLEDSLVKLQALAAFAQTHGDAFYRIEALSKIGNAMKVLNLQDEGVRGAIIAGKSTVDDLYKSRFAVEYYG